MGRESTFGGLTKLGPTLKFQIEMEFNILIQQAKELRALYEALEVKRYGRPWNVTEIGLGLVGDVGDLAKLLQAHEGIRQIDDNHAKLAHELADCLWSIIILADRCDIDLEAEFLKTMDVLRENVRLKLEEK